MKKTLKVIVAAALIAAGAVTFSSCGKDNSQTNNNNTKPVEDKVQGKKEYNKEISKFIGNEEGVVSNYSGFGDFTFTSTVNSVSEENGIKTVKVKNDYVEENSTEKKEQVGEVIYTVSGDSLKEKYTDEHKVSLIDEMIVLKGEPSKDSSWEQDVVIKGETYKAKTWVEDVSEDEKGRKTVSINIQVEGVEGYSDAPYVESRTYTEGFGLTKFTSNYMLSDGSKVPFNFNMWEK